MRAGTQAAWHPSPFACRICHANGIHAGMLPPHPFALLTCVSVAWGGGGDVLPSPTPVCPKRAWWGTTM